MAVHLNQLPNNSLICFGKNATVEEIDPCFEGFPAPAPGMRRSPWSRANFCGDPGSAALTARGLGVGFPVWEWLKGTAIAAEPPVDSDSRAFPCGLKRLLSGLINIMIKSVIEPPKDCE